MSNDNKPKKKTIIPVSSQFDDFRYNKEASGKKHREMGGSDLIQRKFYQDNQED